MSAGKSGSVLGRLEGTGLALASQSNLEVDGREKLIADNGVTNMVTEDSRNVFNLKPASVGRESAQFGNGNFLGVLCVGSLNLVLNMDTPAGESDFRVQLSELYVLDGLNINLFSLHHEQCKQHIVLNDAGMHLCDGRLIFPRGMNSSSLSATRLPPSVLHDGITAVYGSPAACLLPVP